MDGSSHHRIVVSADQRRHHCGTRIWLGADGQCVKHIGHPKRVGILTDSLVEWWDDGARSVFMHLLFVKLSLGRFQMVVVVVCVFLDEGVLKWVTVFTLLGHESKTKTNIVKNTFNYTRRVRRRIRRQYTHQMMMARLCAGQTDE